MQNSVAKKLFAVGSAVAMTLSLVAPFAAQAAAHAVGTNVKSSDGTIWMIMPDGTRRAYTSAGAFLSYGFNSFASVVDANADDLALPAGAFIPPQDGKVMCSDRGADKGTCYLVTGAQKAGFTSAAVFTGLGFSFSRAGYGDVSWMTSTSNIDNTTAAHRPGVLVNNNGTVQLVGATGLLGIPDLATFNSWGYSFANVVPANAADKAMTQTGVMAARVAGQLSPTSLASTPGTPVVSGSVSASLASDTPAASTLVAGAAVAPIAKFTFTGTGTVTEVKFKRMGVSADSTLSNVYLFDGTQRITDAASVGSDSMVSFTNASGLFTVSGSKTITVKADVASSTSGQTVGVQMTSYTVSGGSAATVSLSGAIHTIASATLATADFGTITPSASTIDPANDVVVWQSTLTVSNRDVTLNRMALRQIDSINSSDIRNFRLLVDGTQVAQVQNLDSNAYATFVPASPVTVKTGSRVFKVLADVVGGSSRKVEMSLRNKADIELVDSSYGANVAISDTTPLTAGELTVNSATVTVQKASTSPSGNVTLNGSDIMLGKWTVTAYGEPVKVETLTVGYTHATSGGGTQTSTLRNGRVLINGAQYGSTATVAKTGTSFTVNYTFPAGTAATVEFRADVYDNDGTGAMADGDDIQASLNTGSSNGQGTVSATTVNVPTSSVSANSVNVSAGSISLAKNTTYGNQNSVVPQTAYKVAAYNLTGNSTEDVNIDTISVDFTASGTFAAADLTNVYVMYNGSKQTTKATVSATGNTWSLSQTLAKNDAVGIEIYADIGSSISNGDAIYATMTVSGTTSASGQAASTSATTGQTVTAQSGSISAALDSSAPVAALADDNQTISAAAFKFTSTYDNYTVTDMTFTLASTSPVSSVVVKATDASGNALTYTKFGASTVTFSGMAIPVAANGTKVVTVDLVLGTIVSGGGDSQSDVKVTLTSATADSSTGSQTTVTESNPAGNDIYVFKAIPTVSPASLGATSLVAGTNTLAKTTVSTGGTGSIEVYKLVWTLSKETGPTITAGSLAVYDADTGVQISGTVTSSTDLSSSTSASNATVTFVPTSIPGISGSKTFELKGTVGGTIETTDYITTSIARAQSSFATGVAAASQTGNLVWSDLSAISHSSSTTDWYGDYLVKNLPTTAQTLD